MTGSAADTFDVANVKKAAATASTPKRATRDLYPRTRVVTPCPGAVCNQLRPVRGHRRLRDLADQQPGRRAARGPFRHLAVPWRLDAPGRARARVHAHRPERQARLDGRIPGEAGRRDLPLHALQGDLSD